MSNDKPIVNYEFIKNFYETKGFTNGYNYIEAFYIAKYFYWVLGYGKDKTKTCLKKYCEENDENFNFVMRIGEINNIINKVMKKNLNEQKNIAVTKKELSVIESVKNYRDQKLLFSILIFSKRAKFDDSKINKKRDYIGYRIHNNVIFRIVNQLGYNLSFQKTMDYIKVFVENDFLSPVENSDSIKVLFAQDDSQPLFEVLGKEIPWEKFNEYNGGEWLYCRNCEKKILKISNNHKYCDECKKIIRLEKERNRLRNIRKSNVRFLIPKKQGE